MMSVNIHFVEHSTDWSFVFFGSVHDSTGVSTGHRLALPSDFAGCFGPRGDETGAGCAF